MEKEAREALQAELAALREKYSALKRRFVDAGKKVRSQVTGAWWGAMMKRCGSSSRDRLPCDADVSGGVGMYVVQPPRSARLCHPAPLPVCAACMDTLGIPPKALCGKSLQLQVGFDDGRVACPRILVSIVRDHIH